MPHWSRASPNWPPSGGRDRMKRRGFAGHGWRWLLCLCLLPGLASARAHPIDAARSQASFRVQVRILPATEGRFRGVSGELRSVTDDQWQVRVRLDASDIDFDGPDWLTRVTCSEKFLDVRHYPDIVFESARFPGALLRDGGALAGWLTLRGQRKPVTFTLAPGMCASMGADCPIRVTGEVARRDFGMRAYRFTVRDRVGFDFQVYLQSPVPREPAVP